MGDRHLPNHYWRKIMRRYIKKVLAPVDGSECSKKALDMAMAIAKESHAKLTILEVIEEFGPLPGYYDEAPQGVDRVKWISEQRFEDVHPLLDEENIEWDRIVTEGYPAEKICEIAEKGSYDIIILGSKGRSAISRFLLGSISDRVVHHALCSVCVVK
jgi:nucleotide-binding universal stress UspA family protein